MKTMIIAAAAALSLSMGVAYADSEGGQVANTQFTELSGVSPRLRCRTLRQSRRRRTGRRSTPTWLIRAAERGCSSPIRAVAAATEAKSRTLDREAGRPAPLPAFRPFHPKSFSSTQPRDTPGLLFAVSPHFSHKELGHLIYGAPRCIYTDGSIISQRGSERPRWTIATMLVALSGGRTAVRCLVRVRSRLRF